LQQNGSQDAEPSSGKAYPARDFLAAKAPSLRKSDNIDYSPKGKAGASLSQKDKGRDDLSG